MIDIRLYDTDQLLSEIHLLLLSKIVHGSWDINPNGNIDVIGTVNCSNVNMKKLPFKFNSISQFFDCADNINISFEHMLNIVPDCDVLFKGIHIPKSEIIIYHKLKHIEEIVNR